MNFLVLSPLTVPSGVTINPISIVDPNKKTWIRVDRFKGAGANDYWLNVVIRGDPSSATGVYLGVTRVSKLYTGVT